MQVGNSAITKQQVQNNESVILGINVTMRTEQQKVVFVTLRL